MRAKAGFFRFYLCLAAVLALGCRTLGPTSPAPILLDPGLGLCPAGRAEEGPLLRIALSADSHWGSLLADAAARGSILRSVAASRPPPDAFFILGDNVQLGVLEGEWREESRDLADSLGPIPVRPIPGNHDGLGDGIDHFRKYFFPPRLSSDTGSPLYYSIDAGPALIVVLGLLGGCRDFTGGEKDWLESVLASAPAEKRVILLTHRYFVSSGFLGLSGRPWYDDKDMLGPVAPVLERYSVDLVVSGHNHYMEVLERNGVTYAVVGAMGGVPDPEPSYLSPYSLWFCRGGFGYLELEVGPGGIGLFFKDSTGFLLHTHFIE